MYLVSTRFVNICTITKKIEHFRAFNLIATLNLIDCEFLEEKLNINIYNVNRQRDKDLYEK
jgi:hypothetical protein